MTRESNSVAVCLEGSRMSRFFRTTSALIVVSGLVASSLLGCGSASNNDQGASFTAIGYFADITGETYDLGRITPISLDTSSTTFDGYTQLTYIGLQNRMAAQYIRVDRVDCDYVVPGSTLSIPSDSHSLGGVIEGTGADVGVGDDGEGDGEVVEEGGPTILYAGFFIVSTDISSFLNVNRNSLPELPFQLVAQCRAVGVTQAGDTLVSNDLNYQITFTQAAASASGDDGFQNGPGTGGDVESTIGDDGGETEELSDSGDGDSNVSDDDFVIE